eukprot:1035432-Prorocentrum_minimum.AAC.1
MSTRLVLGSPDPVLGYPGSVLGYPGSVLGYPGSVVGTSSQLARPNVLMFGDWGVNTERIHKQTDAFEEWTGAVPADAKVRAHEPIQS